MKRLTLVLLLITALFGAACSSRFEPAPVETLSTRIASTNNLTEISGDTYTVQAGDTLFAIAFYSGNTYRDLAKINNIPAPYNIQVGQTLRLTPAPPKNIANKNINVAKSAQKSTKVVVDPPSAQAYGGNKQAKARKKQTKRPANSIKADKIPWIWPATGENKIATVGSDGSNRGLDIKGRLGSEIVASASGKVVYAGNALKGYGNLIIIKHDDEYLSAYAHNDKILVGEQTYVEQGQKIATMGQSGASEVMLHFEIRKKGKSRDPFLYLPKE
ncbi:peptidoglycan DD-metalloendopeptidase family protein [Glaciecola siphonariae]|uniref:Peptidoglycan DD-metalloendopeptidase family protein n=1 Tax=Glaciecola siphonariae TaxID=521012 RepID=A0ABV9LWK9_9ALTE